jgi:hypothetical protein
MWHLSGLENNGQGLATAELDLFPPFHPLLGGPLRRYSGRCDELRHDIRSPRHSAHLSPRIPTFTAAAVCCCTPPYPATVGQPQLSAWHLGGPQAYSSRPQRTTSQREGGVGAGTGAREVALRGCSVRVAQPTAPFLHSPLPAGPRGGSSQGWSRGRWGCAPNRPLRWSRQPRARIAGSKQP